MGFLKNPIVALFLSAVLLFSSNFYAYSVEKKFNGIFSGTQELSSAPENDCSVIGGAPSIRLQNGTISGIGFFQDIKGSVSGDQVVFQNNYGKYGLRYAGTITKRNSDYIIKGAFSETSGSTCNGNFVLVGGDVSNGDSDETKNNVIRWLRKFSPIEELLSRRSTTNQIVDGAFVADKPQYTPGLWELKTNTVFTNEAKVVNVPISYHYGSRFKLTAEMPIVWLEDKFISGNVSGSAVMSSGTFEEQVLLNSVIFDLPVGNEDISTGGGNFQVGQAWIKDTLGSRLLLSYYYRYTGVSGDLDTGDTLNLTMGINSPWSNNNVYGILSYNAKSENVYNGFKLGDDRVLMDFSLGLLNKPNAFRIGLNMPVLTLTDDYLNSERLISLDIGYSFE